MGSAALRVESWSTLLLAGVMIGGVIFLLVPVADDGRLSSTDGILSAKTSDVQLGTNLTEVSDWSSQRPFIDLFKQSRRWLTQCDPARDSDCDNSWDTGEAERLDLDEHGWVRSLPAPDRPGYSIAATVLDQPNSLPAGRYVMRYAGSGELRYGLGARRIDAASTPGRDVLEVDPRDGAVLIQIYSTDPSGTGDYLRDLRLVRADDEQLLLSGQRFNPEFLARTQEFQVLRFMEWMRTNGSTLERWSERARSEDATYTSPTGVPAEVMIELSNVLETSIWLTMPHRANDDFVQRFARLVRGSLAPDLRVYVEYSNEVWNSSFAQQAWVAEQARALWPGGGASDFTKALNWYGKRSAEVCEIWKTAFAQQPNRVVCVMGGQAANAWVMRQALECPLWRVGKPCRQHGIDAIAIAPYFGAYVGDPANEAQLEAWAMDDLQGEQLLFQELEEGGLLPKGPAGGALAQASDWVKAHVDLSTELGLPLIAYEAGQHLVGLGSTLKNTAVTDLLIAVNRAPRMGRLYGRYLQEWSTGGGGLLMHFRDIGTPSAYGSWGALEHVGQVGSPKYTALLRYLSLDQPPWAAIGR